MSHATVTPLQLATPDVRTALTEYQLHFLEALGTLQVPEDIELGERETWTALDVKYPINVGDPLFEKLVADQPTYRRLGESFLTLNTDRYQAGVIELAQRLRSSEWARRGWGAQPKKHSVALRLLYSALLATALKTGESTASVENVDGSSTIKFFQT